MFRNVPNIEQMNKSENKSFQLNRLKAAINWKHLFTQTSLASVIMQRLLDSNLNSNR